MQTEANPKATLSDYLAAERTLLAWIRTGLALMGFGFVVARFGLFLQEMQIAQHAQVVVSYGLSKWFGTTMIAASVVVNLFAAWRHIQLLKSLAGGQKGNLHSTTLAVATSVFLALVGLVMATYLVSVGG